MAMALEGGDRGKEQCRGGNFGRERWRTRKAAPGPWPRLASSLLAAASGATCCCCLVACRVASPAASASVSLALTGRASSSATAVAAAAAASWLRRPNHLGEAAGRGPSAELLRRHVYIGGHGDGTSDPLHTASLLGEQLVRSLSEQFAQRSPASKVRQPQQAVSFRAAARSLRAATGSSANKAAGALSASVPAAAASALASASTKAAVLEAAALLDFAAVARLEAVLLDEMQRMGYMPRTEAFDFISEDEVEAVQAAVAEGTPEEAQAWLWLLSSGTGAASSARGKSLIQTSIEAELEAGNFDRAREQLRLMLVDGAGTGGVLDAPYIGRLLRTRSRADDVAGARFLMEEARSYGLSMNLLDYEAMVRCCSKKSSNEEVRYWFHEATIAGLKPSSDLYYHNILSLMREGKPQLAAACFEKMVQSGLQPEGPHFDAVISSYYTAGEVDIATTWLTRMRKAGLKPGFFTFNMPLAACAKAGDLQGAERWFARLLAEDLPPGISTLHALICAAGRAGEVARAENWFERIPEFNLEPNVKAYNQMMEAWSLKGDIAQVKAWFQRISTNGLTPNADSYAQVLTSLATSGTQEETHEWLQRMQQKRIRPEDNVLGEAIASCGGSKGLTGQFELVRALRSTGLEPGPVSWKVLLRSGCGDDFSRAQGVLEDMRRQGVAPEGPAYDALVRACSHVWFGGHLLAEGVLAAMRSFGLTPSKETYYYLVYSYESEGKILEAAEVLQALERDGVQGSGDMYGSVVGALSRAGNHAEAAACLARMVIADFEPHAKLGFLVLRGCVSARLEEDAMVVLGALVAKGKTWADWLLGWNFDNRRLALFLLRGCITAGHAEEVIPALKTILAMRLTWAKWFGHELVLSVLKEQGVLKATRWLMRLYEPTLAKPISGSNGDEAIVDATSGDTSPMVPKSWWSLLLVKCATKGETTIVLLRMSKLGIDIQSEAAAEAALKSLGHYRMRELVNKQELLDTYGHAEKAMKKSNNAYLKERGAASSAL